MIFQIILMIFQIILMIFLKKKNSYNLRKKKKIFNIIFNFNNFIKKKKKNNFNIIF